MTDDEIERIAIHAEAACKCSFDDVNPASTIRELQSRIEALQAERNAADNLAEVTEACLRMMDDVLKGTGKGDMALKPDGSLGLIEGWKRLAAYNRARSNKEPGQ